MSEALALIESGEENPSYEDTYIFAQHAFGEVKDKSGVLLKFTHSVRIATVLEKYGVDYQLVALLHDVVEDTPYTLDDLRDRGYSEQIVRYVDMLTRRKGEEYPDLIRRACEDEFTARIKLVDNRDNSNEARMKHLGTKAPSKRSDYSLARSIIFATHPRLIEEDEGIKNMVERLYTRDWKLAA